MNFRVEPLTAPPRRAALPRSPVQLRLRAQKERLRALLPCLGLACNRRF